MSKNKISILLLKSGKSVADALRDNQISHETIHGYEFYHKTSHSHAPKWVSSFFDDELQSTEQLTTQSIQAVLFVPLQVGQDNRLFAITFGYGRNLLNPSCIEERFGLITTLNSIGSNALRSVDYKNLDTIPISSRVQTGKLSDFQNFEIDTNRDLLKAVTGKPSQDGWGANMTGADSLSISVDNTCSNIEEILGVVYDKYRLDNYKHDFGWIDNLYPVKNKELIDRLDERLIEKLHSDDYGGTWMSIPEVIDWDDIDYFYYKHNGGNYEDLQIQDAFTNGFGSGKDITIPHLKSRNVFAENSQETFRYSWPYYKCLYSEVKMDDKLYILDVGNWYSVEDNFANMINNFYQNMTISNVNLPECYDHNEKEYNESASMLMRYTLMDCNPIKTKNFTSSFEFCDLFENDGTKRIIHVKKYGGSSMLCHLFNQGMVSGQAMLSEEVQKAINEKLEALYAKPLDEPFKASDYEITFVVLSKLDGNRPPLPFFSRVVLKNNVQALRSFGYKVAFKSIKDLSKMKRT